MYYTRRALASVAYYRVCTERISRGDGESGGWVRFEYEEEEEEEVEAWWSFVFVLSVRAGGGC